MKAFLRRLIWIVLLAVSACNQRVPLIDTPVSPTPPVPLVPVQPNQPDVATVNLAHSAVTAGGSLRGVVNLFARAPETGATVSLSSSDNAASVPATVRVSAGEISGEFTVTTLPVSDGRQILITARTAGRSVVAALAIWSELPVDFQWFSEPDDFMGEGGFSRYHSGHSEFSAVCDSNEVRIEIEAPGGEHWSLWFRAPEGAPLRSGTYEGVTQIAPNRPNATMLIKGRDRSCAEANGRFVVREIDLQNDRVNRFRVSFEQQCVDSDRQGWFRGEVRLTDMPPSSSVVTCQR